MNKKFKNKKNLLKTLGILAFGVTPIILSSCSSSTLVKRTVSKNDGSLLETNTSLKDYANYALNSDTGMKEYMQEIVDDLILNWLKKLSQTSNVSFSNSYNNQKTTINDDYKDLVKSYKKKYGNSWSLKFQQEVLDPAGGTEESYKRAKWHSWATSQFETYLFNTNYLTYKDANGNVVDQSQLSSKTVSDLYSALEKQSFQFAAAPNSNDYDSEYANFMQYIWDQYVQIENPYVVDMSLWKYGTPTQGLNTLYKHADSTTTSSGDSSSSGGNSSSSTSSLTTSTQADDSSSSDSSGSGDSSSTTTANAGSYIHPYFTNDSSTSGTSSTGTLNKFAGFVNAASSATDTTINLPSSSKSTSSASSTSGSQTQATATTSTVKIPFKSGYDSNGYGLLYIPNDYTDDSSTYILAKNSSIYSDLYIEFAAASSYLFWRNTGVSSDVTFDNSNSTSSSSSTSYGIPSIDSKITKDISTLGITSDSSTWTDSTTGLDKLTGQFVSTSNIFTNGSQYELKLDKSYVSEIINPNGPLKQIANQDLYVIDSFVPKNNNLTNFMLLRNSAGVHAITIDGYYYINDATEAKSTLSTSEKKKRAGQVVLFRSLYNNINNKYSDESKYNFSVDVQSELKTFYTSNLTWLIYSYATQNSTQKLFDMSALTSLTDNEKALATTINNYLHEISYYTKVDDYNKAMYSGKSTYNQNYGVDAYKNGLAAPWTYQSFTTNDSTTYDSNPIISFQVAATASIVKNPFSTSSNGTNYDGTTYVSNTSLKGTIDTLTNNLNTLSNVSFEGFKYSQYIYSESYYINSVLTAFSSESSDLQDLVKINYLKKYVKNYFNESTLQFTSSINVNSKDIKDNLNYALSNFFFNSSFDSATVKWLKLSNADNDSWSKVVESTTTTTNNTQKDLLKNYKIKLWKEENQVLTSSAISNYLSLYTTIASIVYLLNNDASFFLEYLSNQVTIGSTAYVAWQASQNTELQKDASTTASGLMNADVLKRNINNSFVSSYIGGSNLYKTTSGSIVAAPLTIKYETNLNKNDWTESSNPNVGVKSSYQDSSTTSSYYTVVSGMKGFLGLQTSSSNSMNSLITDRIFTNLSTDNDNGTGILYGYGNSYDSLINYVKNITTISSINNIATDLSTKLQQSSLKQVATNDSLTLDEKKNKIITALENLKSNSSSSIKNVFTSRTGIVTSDKTSENNKQGLIWDSSNPNVQFSSYVIQINNNDLSSLSNFISILKNNNGTSTAAATSTQEDNAYDIFSNLVVQQAVNTSLQSIILSLIISSEGKIKAYDVRLFTALGPEWIENWKVTNTSSSSSSGDSSSSGSGS